jgi:hypothetical protein
MQERNQVKEGCGGIYKKLAIFNCRRVNGLSSNQVIEALSLAEFLSEDLLYETVVD